MNELHCDRVLEDVQPQWLEGVHARRHQVPVHQRESVVDETRPHAGDEGNFGREEIDVIAPALERAFASGKTAWRGIYNGEAQSTAPSDSRLNSLATSIFSTLPKVPE